MLAHVTEGAPQGGGGLVVKQAQGPEHIADCKPWRRNNASLLGQAFAACSTVTRRLPTMSCLSRRIY